VLAALALGVVAQYLFVRERIGLNALIVVALFLAAAWRTRDPARAVQPRDLWLPIGALVFAALCALRADAASLAALLRLETFPIHRYSCQPEVAQSREHGKSFGSLCPCGW